MASVADSSVRPRALTLTRAARWQAVWRLWPEVTILAAVVVAFGPTIFGTAHFPYDAEFFHFPLLSDVQSTLASGACRSPRPSGRQMRGLSRRHR